MLWILLGIVVLIVLAFVVKFLPKQKFNTDFPYRRIDPLFSPAERSLFGVLQKTIGDKVEVFGKVRVADIINPRKRLSRSDWQKAF